MGIINKPSAKPVTPGKMVIREGVLCLVDGNEALYRMHLNDNYFSIDELEEVGNQILALVKAARKEASEKYNGA